MGKIKVNLKVNGKEREEEVEGRQLLVHFLRETLNLTGTHIGCDTSLCGACTVLLNGKAVKSCTVLTAQAEGAEITTVEALQNKNGYHAIQQGFWEEHGLQCGFCTPGMMMLACELLATRQEATEEEIRHYLEGNLCRCTGYQNIVKAIQNAMEKMKAEKTEEAPVAE